MAVADYEPAERTAAEEWVLQNMSAEAAGIQAVPEVVQSGYILSPVGQPGLEVQHKQVEHAVRM
jgi:hypothetical protein